MDYVTTMRVACEQKGSAFTWPKSAFSASHSFAVALTHLPPGYMVSLQNSAPVPVEMQRPEELRRSSGGGTAVGEATQFPAMETDDESEDSSDEETRQQYKQPTPKPASSTWAGMCASWFWLGGRTRAKDDQAIEAANEADDVVDWYHGTEVHNLPRILSEGLRPSVTGAGAYAVQQHYGLLVPAV